MAATKRRCTSVQCLFFLCCGLGEELVLWNGHLNEIALWDLEYRLLARDTIRIKHLLKWHTPAVERGRLIGHLLLRVKWLLLLLRQRHHIAVGKSRCKVVLICCR